MPTVSIAGSAAAMAPICSLQPLHLGERHVLSGFRRTVQYAGVLLREEAFGDDDEQLNGGGDDGEKDQQRHELVAQHDVERATVERRPVPGTCVR